VGFFGKYVGVMAKLTPFTATGLTNVTATINCTQIQVVEVGGGTTAAYTVIEPPAANAGASVAAGQAYNFVAQTGYTYTAGQVVGTVTPASGSINMMMVEA
jgi:hypothetical protein